MPDFIRNYIQNVLKSIVSKPPPFSIVVDSHKASELIAVMAFTIDGAVVGWRNATSGTSYWNMVPLGYKFIPYIIESSSFGAVTYSRFAIRRTHPTYIGSSTTNFPLNVVTAAVSYLYLQRGINLADVILEGGDYVYGYIDNIGGGAGGVYTNIYGLAYRDGNPLSNLNRYVW